MSSTSPATDVLIIGAGISGLAAARSLSQRGLRVLVLEASSLIGGRVRTLRVPGWTLPIELGAEFVHGQPSTTISLAESEGLELRELEDVHALRRGESLVDMGDTWARFAKALENAEHRSPTWSVAKFLEREKLGEDQDELVRLLVEGYHAAPLNDVSARSIAEDALASAEEFRQYRPVGGYQRLIARLEHELSAGRVEVLLGARARRVEWKPGEVTLSLSHGGDQVQLRARHCLVSVSVGVLQASAESGGIEFAPPLSERRGALGRLAMGQVVKVVSRLERSPLELGYGARPPWPDFFHDPDAEFPSIWLQTEGNQSQFTAWAGGPKAIALSGLSPDELGRLAARALARTLALDEHAVRKSVIESHAHDFNRDPLTLGAYSYVRPEGLHAARKLSLPIEDTLFFCGEALDLAYPGTVAGALGSGQHAARQILAARHGKPLPGRIND